MKNFVKYFFVTMMFIAFSFPLVYAAENSNDKTKSDKALERCIKDYRSAFGHLHMTRTEAKKYCRYDKSKNEKRFNKEYAGDK